MIKGGNSQSMDWSKFEQHEDIKKDPLIRSFGRAALMPITGTPEMVVEELQKLSASRVAGVCTAFVDYDEGLDRYNEQLLPLMRQAGLRT